MCRREGLTDNQRNLEEVENVPLSLGHFVCTRREAIIELADSRESWRGSERMKEGGGKTEKS